MSFEISLGFSPFEFGGRSHDEEAGRSPSAAAEFGPAAADPSAATLSTQDAAALKDTYAFALTEEDKEYQVGAVEEKEDYEADETCTFAFI